jgi:hypothetical protein
MSSIYSHSDYRLNIFKICVNNAEESYEMLCSDLKSEGINLNVELLSSIGTINITGIESLSQEQKYPIFKVFERRCIEEKRLDLRDYIYILERMKVYKSEGRFTLEHWTRDMTPVIQLGHDFKKFLPTLVVYTYDMGDDTEEAVFWTQSSHQDQQSYIIDIHLGCLNESWIDILYCKAQASRAV